MSELEESVQLAIKTILNQLKFSQNVEISSSSGREKGEGYLGKIVSITVKDNSDARRLNLVAKISIKNDIIRSRIPVKEAYSNEIYFYEYILPTLKDLHKTTALPYPFSIVPKCYITSGVENEEFLIMDDLKAANFEMFNTKSTMDFDHMKIIFQKYAKFHALTFALKKRDEQKYRELTQQLYSIYMGFLKSHSGTNLPECFKLIQDCLNECGKENRIVKKYTTDVDEVLMGILTNQTDLHSCILHGDSWSNNFMFKYRVETEKKIVTDAKLLDWQACYYGSPVLDLSYALYSGCSKEVLDNFESLLKIYHETLMLSLSQLKCQDSEIYPFEILKVQWKMFSQFGLILGLLVTKINLTDKSNLPDPADSDNKDNSDYFLKVVNAKDACDIPELLKRVEYIFEHLENIGVFEK